MINFVSAGVDILEDNHFSEVLISLDNKIVIGEYRVIFGWRIRGGYLGNQWYEFDLCCGAQEKDYLFLKEKIIKKIQSNPIENPFKDIPNITDRKPYMNDDKFLDLIENW